MAPPAALIAISESDSLANRDERGHMSTEPAAVRELQARLVEELPASTPPYRSEPAPLDVTQLTKRDEIIIQDVCRRHEGLVQLIYHNDRKAVQLIGIYFAIAGAIATLLVANIKTIDATIAVAAVAILICLFFGIVSAFRAHWTTPICLSGMKPDFWDWARKHSVPADDMVDEYLTRSTEGLDTNENVNNLASRHLKRAYIAGISATATAIAMIALPILRAGQAE
jgi:hypothetical protein